MQPPTLYASSMVSAALEELVAMASLMLRVLALAVFPLGPGALHVEHQLRAVEPLHRIREVAVPATTTRHLALSTRREDLKIRSHATVFEHPSSSHAYARGMILLARLRILWPSLHVPLPSIPALVFDDRSCPLFRRMKSRKVRVAFLPLRVALPGTCPLLLVHSLGRPSSREASPARSA